MPRVWTSLGIKLEWISIGSAGKPPMFTFTHLCHLWISPVVSDNLIYLDCSSKWPQKFPLLSTAPAGQSAAHYDTVRQRRLLLPRPGQAGPLTITYPSRTSARRFPSSRVLLRFLHHVLVLPLCSWILQNCLPPQSRTFIQAIATIHASSKGIQIVLQNKAKHLKIVYFKGPGPSLRFQACWCSHFESLIKDWSLIRPFSVLTSGHKRSCRPLESPPA